MPTRIDPTTHLLAGKLTEAAGKQGAEMIGKWEADLEEDDWRGAKTIHEDLVERRRHLERDTLDGTVIGELPVQNGRVH